MGHALTYVLPGRWAQAGQAVVRACVYGSWGPGGAAPPGHFHEKRPLQYFLQPPKQLRVQGLKQKTRTLRVLA